MRIKTAYVLCLCIIFLKAMLTSGQFGFLGGLGRLGGILDKVKSMTGIMDVIPSVTGSITKVTDLFSQGLPNLSGLGANLHDAFKNLQPKAASDNQLEQLGFKMLQQQAAQIYEAVGTLSKKFEKYERVMDQGFQQVINKITQQSCRSLLSPYETSLKFAITHFNALSKEPNSTFRGELIASLSRSCNENKCMESTNGIISLMNGDCNMPDIIFNSTIGSQVYFQQDVDRFAKQISYWTSLANMGMIVSGFELAARMNNSEDAERLLNTLFLESYTKMIDRCQAKLEQVYNGMSKFMIWTKRAPEWSLSYGPGTTILGDYNITIEVSQPKALTLIFNGHGRGSYFYVGFAINGVIVGDPVTTRKGLFYIDNKGRDTDQWKSVSFTQIEQVPAGIHEITLRVMSEGGDGAINAGEVRIMAQ